MIVKGYIESVSSVDSVKVRVPFLNGIQGQVDSTPTDELPDAVICQMPNVNYHCAIGDVVWVNFENTRWEAPVIVGFLNKEQNSTVDITADELFVKKTAELPTETKIGDVESSSVACLKGLDTNLADYLKLTTPCYTLDLTGVKSGDKIDISVIQSIPDDAMIIVKKEDVAGTISYYPLIQKTAIATGDNPNYLDRETLPQYNYIFANVLGVIKIEGGVITSVI